MGDVPRPPGGAPTPVLPRVGPESLRVLDYGRISAAERIASYIRFEHLTYLVAGATYWRSATTGRTPQWVALLVTATSTLLWYLYARERAARRRSAIWLVTDQLLLAAVLSVGGMFAVLERASALSRGGYWLPYNQTYYLNPAWALEPLWVTGIGLVWFAAVWILIQLQLRHRRAIACSEPTQSK